MANKEFNPQLHEQQINDLINPALHVYRLILLDAGVLDEDVDRVAQKVEVRSKQGVRKALEFAEFADQFRIT